MQLFIDTYGTYVHVKDEMFEVRIPDTDKDNNKEYKKHHFAAKKVTCILMPKAASLSTDAIILALKYNVDIVFIDYNGQPIGRVWHSKLGSTTRISKAQLQCYALLVEHNFQKHVNRAFLVYVRSKNKLVEVDIRDGDKIHVMQCAFEIGKIIENNFFPKATSVKKRCLTCT